MKIYKNRLYISAVFLGAFVLWTAALYFVDVQPIGPDGSLVGFGTVNGYVHSLTGVHFVLYTVTDWLGLVPIAVCAVFGVMGLAQLVKRKSLQKVDRDIIVMGIYYVAVIALYLLFEAVKVNCRPVLINGVLEASYPSSTTMLVMCVMPTAAMQAEKRIKNSMLKKCAVAAAYAFTVFMVTARFVSGVHWFSDIVGGVLLSAGMVMLYSALSGAELK